MFFFLIEVATCRLKGLAEESKKSSKTTNSIWFLFSLTQLIELFYQLRNLIATQSLCSCLSLSLSMQASATLPVNTRFSFFLFICESAWLRHYFALLPPPTRSVSLFLPLFFPKKNSRFQCRAVRTVCRILLTIFLSRILCHTKECSKKKEERDKRREQNKTGARTKHDGRRNNLLHSLIYFLLYHYLDV